MSRIGRKPVAIPAGTDVSIADGNVVTVKGKLGTLTQALSSRMIIKKDGDVINVSRPSDEKEDRALHGLTRTLINNMVIGVTEGYSKKLEIVGVGYRAQKSGKTLTLNLGYSHPITFEEKDGITFETPDTNTVIVRGTDNSLSVRSQLRFVNAVRLSHTLARELNMRVKLSAARPVSQPNK